MNNVFRSTSAISALAILLGLTAYDFNVAVQGYFISELPTSSVVDATSEDSLLPTEEFTTLNEQTVDAQPPSVHQSDLPNSGLQSSFLTPGTTPQPLVPQTLAVLSANIFTPHIATIQQSLAEGLVMRLPEEVILLGKMASSPSHTIQVLPADDQSQFSIQLTTCEGEQGCQTGYFHVAHPSHSMTIALWQAHRERGASMRLADGIEGYLLTHESNGVLKEDASLMWQQDGLVYTIQFPAQERQNILNMAQSMALGTPIVGQANHFTEVETHKNTNVNSEVPQLIALSSDLFVPHLDTIRASLSPEVQMRLPAEVLIFGHQSQGIKPDIQVIASDNNNGLAIELSNCSGQANCSIGHFVVAPASDLSEAETFQQHQERGYSVTLGPDLQAFLLTKEADGTERDRPSLMWEQDQHFYSVQFPAQDRQNMLYMARSMALSTPIYGYPSAGERLAHQSPTSQSSQSSEPTDLQQSNVTDTDIAQDRVISSPPIHAQSTELATNLDSSDVFWVKGVTVKGSQVFSENELRKRLDQVLQVRQIVGHPEQGMPLGLEDLDALAKAIADLYPTEGYLTATASVESVDDGVAKITVVEQERLEYLIPDSDSDVPILIMAQANAPIAPIPIPVELNEGTPGDGNSTPSPSSENETSVEQQDAPQNAPQNNVPSVQVKEIQVLGSSIFDDNDLADIFTSFEDQNLTVEQIRDVADAITQLYLNQGYVTTRAVPMASDTIGQDGILTIQVIEGEIAEIEIIPIHEKKSTEETSENETVENNNQDSEEKSLRIRESYIRNRIKLGTGVPFNSTKLENQLRLLRADPLFASVEASLRPIIGEQGKSKLIVRVLEADPFSYGFSIDNYSPPSVGSERAGITLSHRNLTGQGDELSASYTRSTTSGAENYNVMYRLPVNAMNGTVQLRAAPNNYTITDPEFVDLNIRGEQELYEIIYRQPLMRSPREEFALSAGFKHQAGQTFIGDRAFPFGFGPDEDAFSRTSVFNVGQDYIRRDSRGAWSVRSQFDFGTGLFDATTNDEPEPDGHFFSWLGQAQRVEQLSQDHLLLVQGEVQLSPDSLLPAQRFIIGGGQSTRGYRQNARSGDNGLRFSVEDRITLNRNSTGAPIIQIAPFVDVGAVWNSDDNPNELEGTTVLSGAGFGLLFDQVFGQEGLSLRFDLGVPLVDWENRGDNVQDAGFYFNLRYGQ